MLFRLRVLALVGILIAVAAVPSPRSRASSAAASTAPPSNSDEIDQSAPRLAEEEVRPKDARSAAWLALVQALFSSAEFRYTR
jgi:hypothetical protein